jgi:hypothetical protein
MTRPSPRWLGHCLDAARALGERRACLLLVLLLLNAIALPYAGFVHDARLYGVQVLNRVGGGAFDDDLFLRYGSQDQYSAFSAVVGPVTAALGLPWTFFLLYIACNAVFLWGALRLVGSLIEDRALATVALIFLAMTPLPFGGFRIFHVNENFLTPRVLTNALVLHALADLLQGRNFRPLLLLAAAFLLHPIMALTGVGVYAVWQAAARLPARWSCGLLGAAALATSAVLFWPPLGWRLFGHMDAEWLHGVWAASTYNFPLEWMPADWLDVVATLALTAAATLVLWRERPRQARLLAAVALVAGGGLLATTVASVEGYALLFQAQPYRALWLAKFLQAPLTLVLAVRLWGCGTERARVAALLLLGHLAVTTFMPTELACPLAVLPLAILVCRGLDREPRRPDWLSGAVAASLAVGFVVWALYRTWVLLRFSDLLWEHVERSAILLVMLTTLGPAVWMLVGLSTARAVARRLGTGALAMGVCAGAALAVQLATFAVPRSDLYRTGFSKYHDDTPFVADFLRRHDDGGRLPTVYWPIGRVDMLWMELGVKSYFERLQVVGVLFSRETALEGVRRARVVAGFEGERLRQEQALLGQRNRELLEALLGIDLDSARPTRADLERLCREEGVDYAVVRQRFDGLYSATNGRFYIYNCRQIRAALGPPAPSATAAASPRPAASPPGNSAAPSRATSVTPAARNPRS